MRFEKNAADSRVGNGNTLVTGAGDTDTRQSSILFSDGNVDHNSITLDSKGTFHGMGSMAVSIRRKKNVKVISRQDPSSLDFTAQSKVPLKDYIFSKHALSKVTFQRHFKDIAITLVSHQFNVCLS